MTLDQKWKTILFEAESPFFLPIHTHVTWLKYENNEGQIGYPYLKSFGWWIMADEEFYERDIRY